jgi:hypothetical protein
MQILLLFSCLLNFFLVGKCHQSYEFKSIECLNGKGLTLIEICTVDKREAFFQLNLLKNHEEVTVSMKEKILILILIFSNFLF